MTTQTNVERTQAEFIAYVEKEGLIHALEWIGSWYDRAAQASVEDDLVAAFGDRAKDPEIRELHLTDHLLSTASSVSNPGTSVGHNTMRAAFTSVRATMLQRSGALRRKRDARWEAVRANTESSPASAETTDE